MAVQPNYNATLDIGYEGQVADLRSTDIVSRICEPTSIGFGKAVIKGTGDKQVTLGAGGTFIGVAVRDIALPAANADVYKANDTVGVMTRGTMFVVAGANVTAGAAAYYTSAGVITPTASGNTAIPNGRFEKSASSGDLTILRIS